MHRRVRPFPHSHGTSAEDTYSLSFQQGHGSNQLNNTIPRQINYPVVDTVRLSQLIFSSAPQKKSVVNQRTHACNQ
ncbi:hypothetical protein GQ55_9G273800 [Panicum hallii var. hallii]|uniref:Uncharacterized protein n=1 Tax=Panicum hallii var. hallii TaxID=1504633 RepID=A0A2T7C7E2_9POAL|nr:hypothetical protein PVAP13_J683918 [Panicum virgatum]PUZ39269.1 hypothetical protein GQ55_9G273800 [Panicum hallii var. hallii]